MKIVFGQNEFEVTDVRYSLDKFGEPVDIVITADEDTLLNISQFARIGCNIQESYWRGVPEYEALFARLLDFKVIGAKHVRYLI